jgi:hypothetical protein
MSRRGEETLVGSRNPVDPGQATERFSGLMRLAAGATIALVLFAIIGFLWGPAASLDALREAAARRDNAEIARRIDGPALLATAWGACCCSRPAAPLPGGWRQRPPVAGPVHCCRRTCQAAGRNPGGARRHCRAARGPHCAAAAGARRSGVWPTHAAEAGMGLERPFHRQGHRDDPDRGPGAGAGAGAAARRVLVAAGRGGGYAHERNGATAGPL